MYRMIHQVVHYILFASKHKIIHSVATLHKKLVSKKGKWFQPDGPPCTACHATWWYVFWTLSWHYLALNLADLNQNFSEDVINSDD